MVTPFRVYVSLRPVARICHEAWTTAMNMLCISVRANTAGKYVFMGDFLSLFLTLILSFYLFDDTNLTVCDGSLQELQGTEP